MKEKIIKVFKWLFSPDDLKSAISCAIFSFLFVIYNIYCACTSITPVSHAVLATIWFMLFLMDIVSCIKYSGKN